MHEGHSYLNINVTINAQDDINKVRNLFLHLDVTHLISFIFSSFLWHLATTHLIVGFYYSKLSMDNLDNSELQKMTNVPTSISNKLGLNE